MAQHVSVVVSTYERPDALDVVLRALSEQRDGSFDVIVADDGSGDDTDRVAHTWRAHLDLRHVWQPNDGFMKARLLNRAVLGASGDYIVFLDGDCIPRLGFVQAMRRAALPGWFAASKRLHLSPRLTADVLANKRPIWRWSSTSWLLRAPRELVLSPHRQANRPGVLLPMRDRDRPWNAGSKDFRPPYNGYGYAFGVSRRDFERVNGFDMRLRGWDGEDVDIARRLHAAGLRCGWPGPDASVLHLWHPDRKRPARRFPENDGFQASLGLWQLALELGETDQVSANRVTASSSSSDPV